MSDRVRVLLLFGGRSAEHDVSRVSAVAVARALDPERYDIVPVAITKEGRWLLSEDARELLATARDALPAAFEVEGAPVTELPEPGSSELVPLDDVASGRGAVAAMGFDVVVPLLHGPYGEDGTVQGLFELAGVPYVGAGVVGSAVAMDKVMMKHAFAAAGLPIARWRSLREGHDVDAFVTEVESELGYPCFVKPANLGSSVGVSKALDRGALVDAIDLALRFDEWVIAEEAIVGREIEVGILGDDPPLASVPGEIVPGDEFYSYADKYEEDDADLRVPAPLTDDQTGEVRALAVRAFEACRGEAMARVDFLFEEERTDGSLARGFIVNEVNTIPGFTEISMYPRLWEASGVSFGELLDRLIALARARHERRTPRGQATRRVTTNSRRGR